LGAPAARSQRKDATRTPLEYKRSGIRGERVWGDGVFHWFFSAGKERLLSSVRVLKMAAAIGLRQMFAVQTKEPSSHVLSPPWGFEPPLLSRDGRCSLRWRFLR
jgi:hypothetical protein